MDRYFGSPIEPQRFVDLLRQLAQQSHINEPTFRNAVKGAIAGRIEVKSALPSRHDLERATGLIKCAGLDDWSHMRLRLAQASILRHIDDGVLPRNVRLVGSMPLNLEAGEQLIYIFNGVSRYSMHSHSRYVGGYSGISFRIARGVYYRVGGSRGHSVKTEQFERDGTGDLVVTTKNVIFFAATGPIKIPAKKIVSVQTLSDGVIILRDGSRAKQEIYSLSDPWFAGQLVSRSGRMSGLRRSDEAHDPSESDESVLNAAPPLGGSSGRSAVVGAWTAIFVGLVLILTVILASITNYQPVPGPAPAQATQQPSPETTAAIPQQKAPPSKPRQPGKPLDLLPPPGR